MNLSMGLVFRIIGGGLLIFAMLGPQSYFYLLMSLGLLLYVVGLFIVKSKKPSEKND